MTLHLAEAIPFDLSLSQAVLADVGYGWHVAIDGHQYLIDLRSGEFKYRSIPLLRPQTDDSAAPGEASLAREDAWRASVTSWHLGAGQPNADRDPTGRTLSPSRFRSSKGVDIWTDDQISLLADTDEKRTSANTNLKMIRAGARVYIIDGNDCAYATDLTGDTPTFTGCTGEPGGTLVDIASDGYKVWITDGSNVYEAATDDDSFASWSTQDVDVLTYVKGRLMAAHDNQILYCTDFSTPTFTSLFTHPNTAFSWVGFAEGRAAIYAAGQAGDKALVYRIPIKPDGSALDVPIVAFELPDGETITGIGGYLGFIFLGTTEGIRFCEADTQGNLTAGSPFGPESCRCFEGQGRYVWFGWTAYDATSTGLGRCTPRRFADVDERIPVYASDLMSAGSGAVRSIVTHGSKRYYAVSGDGFYGETATLVASGTIDSGDYGLGLVDEKMSLSVDLAYADFVGTVTVSLAADGGSFTQIGATTDTGTVTERFPTSQKRGERLEVRLVLTQATSTTGPTVTRWTLRAQPAPALAYMHVVPLILRERVTLDGGGTEFMDVQAELEHLVDLNRSRSVVTFQRGSVAHQVVVDDFEWRQDRLDDAAIFEGVALVALKEV